MPCRCSAGSCYEIRSPGSHTSASTAKPSDTAASAARPAFHFQSSSFQQQHRVCTASPVGSNSSSSDSRNTVCLKKKKKIKCISFSGGHERVCSTQSPVFPRRPSRWRRANTCLFQHILRCHSEALSGAPAPKRTEREKAAALRGPASQEPHSCLKLFCYYRVIAVLAES